MMDVVGIYRGRPYVARMADNGIWVVRSDGPVFVFPALAGEEADAVRIRSSACSTRCRRLRAPRHRNAAIQAGSRRAMAGARARPGTAPGAMP